MHNRANAFDGVSASIFDSRCSATSTLSVLLPQSSTLLILTISRIAGGRISVVPLLQTSAAAATPALATRPRVLDLLFVSPEAKWAVISAEGKIESVEGPALPSGKRIAKLSGDGSKEVVVTFEDTTRCVTAIPQLPTGLAMDCLHALSLALPLETFINLQSAISSWSRTAVGSSDFGAIVAILGGGQSVDSTPAECIPDTDPIFANLRSSPSLPAPAPPPRQQISNPLSDVERSAAFHALHLLSEDYRLFNDTNREYQELVGLLIDMAASMGLEDWVDEYRRATGRPFKASIGQSRARFPSERNADILSTGPTTVASSLPTSPVSISNMLMGSLLASSPSPPIHDISSIAKNHGLVPSLFYGHLDTCHRTRTLIAIYSRLSPSGTSIESPSVRSRNAVLTMYARGWGREQLEKVVFGIALPIWEAVRLCQLDAPEYWPEGAYEIIRRDDLARQVGGKIASGVEKRVVSLSCTL